MDPHLKALNPQKMTKVDEAAKEVKPSKYDRPENWKPPPPKAEPKPKVVAKKAPAKKAAAVVVESDEDMADEVIAPKRAPPKGIGVKPKKKTEDVEMDDQEDAPAPKKAARAPPNIGKAPPKKAPAGPTKAPTAPVIQEEDLGAGLTKESAIEKASEYFSGGIIAKFDAAKW